MQACRTQAKSIAAETAAIDEARYAREVENGVSGPLDKEFAEMVLLRNERRQLQVRQLLLQRKSNIGMLAAAAYCRGWISVWPLAI